MSSYLSRFAALAFLLLFVLTPRLAAAGFRWLEPSPQGNDLRNIVFLDNVTAIAAGEGGTVMVTHDGGATWSASVLTVPVGPVFPDIEDVARVNSSTAVLSSNSGFYRTTNAGQTWTHIPGAATAMDFFGNLGAALHGNEILRSLDGGQWWATVSTGKASCIDVVSSTVIVGAGSGSFISSTDGGTTWASTAFPPTDFTPVAISFIDNLHGAVVASGDRMYVTGNGGQSWVERPFNQGLVSAVDVEMLDVNTFDVVTTTKFLHSIDGGATWTSDPALHHFSGIAIAPSGDVLVSGAEGTVSRWTSADGIEPVAGSTFQATDDGGRVAFVDSDHGIMVGSRQPGSPITASTAILRTSDGGDTWSQTLLSATHLTDVAMTISGAYAVGCQNINGALNQVVLNSSDGGQSWAPIWSTPISNSGHELSDVAFSSATHGIAISKYGALRIDNNVVTPATGLSLLGTVSADLATGSDAIAVVVAGNLDLPRLFRTTDGGTTWTEISVYNVAHRDRLTAVAFASPQVCVVGGEHDTMIRSEDGGLTWADASFVWPQMPNEIRAIAFSSPTHGLAVADVPGVDWLAETFDGGQTWSAMSTPIVSTDDVAAFEQPLHAIITGSGPQAIEYSTPITPVVSAPHRSLELLPNHPNPFNPSTTIRFVLPERDHVRLSIYDAAGHRVATLVDEVRSAGMYSIEWNGTDWRGSRVASGVYVTRLESGSSSVTGKMVLLK